MTKFMFCALVAFAASVQGQTNYRETVLHDFTKYPWPKGASPNSLILDSAGDIIGTALGGGLWNQGVAFRIDTAGHETVLHSFAGGSEGALPYGLVSDGAGNFYGVTQKGGGGVAPGCGVIFKLDAAGNETVLHTFTGADGDYAEAGLVLQAGNLYGTTFAGGAHGSGNVFKFDIGTGAETVLYSFTDGADGGYPQGPVTFDAAGNLYGVASGGGMAGAKCSQPLAGCGVAYKVDPAGNETVLYTFTGGSDGAQPFGPVALDSQGNVYGIAGSGETPGAGLVFKVDPAGRETVFHRFVGGAGGSNPNDLIRDSAGNLYGATNGGGVNDCNKGYNGCGVLFKLDPAGNETVLYSFTGIDGSNPYYVISGAAGNFYGAASEGGTAGLGVVFKLAISGQETTLYSFPAGIDVYHPAAGVTLDAAGNIYGTTANGGDLNIYDCGGTYPTGCGVVYKIDTTGHETVLHIFTDGNDGAIPSSAVTLDSAGNIYGTTPYGGEGGGGILYKLDAAGKETIVHTFASPGQDQVDGAQPLSGLTPDSAGNFYGTTYFGGTLNLGVVYKVDASGKETVVHSFTDAGRPSTGVVLDPAGNIYGTNSGAIYKIDTGGNYTILYSFTGGADGRNPNTLTRDAAGNLYGTTEYGGACHAGDACGVVFKFDTAGKYTVLYTFAGGPDGRNPLGALVMDAAGNLYGTTQLGGTSNLGIVFQIDSQGNETVLHNFSGPPDGREPQAGVTLDPSGNLYGTTYEGGKQKGGLVFKLSGAGS